MTITRWNPDHYQTYLHRADFSVFQEVYHLDKRGMPLDDYDSCDACSGCGGFITTEYQGDPPMGGSVDFFTQCPDCIDQALCPGCMQPLSLSFDLSAFEATTEWIQYDNPHYATNMGYLKRSFDYEDAISAMPFEGFTCLCCGWQYDPDRHADQYDDDYDDGEYDDPAWSYDNSW